MEHSQQFLKRRKFLVALPLIMWPFVTIVFWLLGGGSGAAAGTAPVKSGLNTQLPDAKNAGTSMVDKMSFYAMADRDSVKRGEQIRMDPNFSPMQEKPVAKAGKLNTSFASRGEIDDQQEKINERLRMLQTSLRDPVRKPIAFEDVSTREIPVVKERQSDPEMEAINSTLEKLLDVQHPERVKERVVEKKPVGYSVRVSGSESASYFGKTDTVRSGFYGSDDAGTVGAAAGEIAAAIHGGQVLQNGSVVKLRLLNHVFVNGVQVPVGSFVYGIAALQEERLHVSVSAIQFENHLFPVSLKLFDMDGVEGIYVPGSATREVAKQSGEQAVQSLGIVNMDPSLKAQATAAGISAAKGLLTKKVKLVRVTVKANYKVLLKDENAK
ncbi:conjugative transposon protein TraM [Sediminibacterium roseum]|uniref:Conjugative transposon protein TraM n=1 Tax=Sediminibacterium roseum TaxID=1978412 RepID=A0ABW9ZVW8_9BACT|nr:conjugative transposon protein TraM [Sediminibacterium roseum]NCI51299.1 conjugative transposon protein TraM [Sediminibacterium roseum]